MCKYYTKYGVVYYLKTWSRVCVSARPRLRVCAMCLCVQCHVNVIVAAMCVTGHGGARSRVILSLLANFASAADAIVIPATGSLSDHHRNLTPFPPPRLRNPFDLLCALGQLNDHHRPRRGERCLTRSSSHFAARLPQRRSFLSGRRGVLVHPHWQSSRWPCPCVCAFCQLARRRMHFPIRIRSQPTLH